MRRSEDRILTSHVGSLHPPRDLQDLLLAADKGELADAGQLDERLRTAVEEVVRHQRKLGVDIVDDGEFSKSSWMGYAAERLGGIEIVSLADTVGEGERLDDSELFPSKDQRDFDDFYNQARSHMFILEPGAGEELEARAFARDVKVVGPIRYEGHNVIARDIANLKAAAEAAGVEEAFMPVVAPGSVQPWITNEHYTSTEQMFADIAAALRHEYKAIVDAGLIVQIDDAFIANEWDHQLALDPGYQLETFREWANLAVEAVNSALVGIPEDRVRYHLCWGSWNGPHSTDIPLRDIVDLILKVNAQTYAIEAANARHEWEFRVWEDVKLPEGKILMPGVIEHSTNVVEHPETVAERILRFAELLGRENVIAGTDCGFRNRSHPQVAWAKLRALSEGAQLASKRLWK